MITLRYQIALFYKNMIKRPDEIYVTLNKKMGNLFDSVPTVIPLASEIPGDIPMVQLSSKDDKYKCTISKDRTHFFYFPQEEMAIDDYVIKAKKFIEYILKVAKVNRIGFISQNIIKDENPVNRINQFYFNFDLSKSKEINIRFNILKEFRGISINDVIDVKNAMLENRETREMDDVILIQRDMNTDSQNTKELTREILDDFIDSFKGCLVGKEIERLI